MHFRTKEWCFLLTALAGASPSTGFTAPTLPTTVIKNARTSPSGPLKEAVASLHATAGESAQEEPSEIKRKRRFGAITKLSSRVQLYFLLHPGKLSSFMLTLFYNVDVVVYTVVGAKEFLGRRQDLIGPNFAALGKLICGDYDDAASIIGAPQIRGQFLGRARIADHRYPSFFPLFLSDKEAGGKDKEHQNFHLFFWETIVPDATKRLEKEKAAFDKYTKDLVDELKQVRGGSGNPTVKEASTPVQTFIAKYMFHALFGIKLDEENLELVRTLAWTGNPTSNYVIYAVKPLALPDALVRPARDGAAKMVDMITNSEALKDYEPTPANNNLSKQEWADVLWSIIAIAALGGTFNLALFALTEIPETFPLDTSDQTAVMLAVMETARRHSPVNNVNVLLPTARTFEVAGKAYEFPIDTVVAASIGAASLDAAKFPNPDNFDPNRGHLLSSSLNFNSVGFDATEPGTRVCPGRNVALKCVGDLLVAWRH